MKSKKRYVIAFWIAASLVVALGIGMVAVLAAFEATTSGGSFSVSYTAYHVNAEITAAYKEPNDADYTNLNVSGTSNSTMTFNSSDTGSPATKAFDNGPRDVKFTRSYKVMVLRYTVKNTGSAAIKINKTIVENPKENVTIEYASSNGLSSIPTTDPTSWQTSANTALADGTEIAAGKILVFYVQITLTSDTAPANYTGSYNFALSAVDAN